MLYKILTSNITIQTGWKKMDGKRYIMQKHIKGNHEELY